MLKGPARAPDLGSTRRTYSEFSRTASSRIGLLTGISLEGALEEDAAAKIEAEDEKAWPLTSGRVEVGNERLEVAVDRIRLKAGFGNSMPRATALRVPVACVRIV